MYCECKQYRRMNRRIVSSDRRQRSEHNEKLMCDKMNLSKLVLPTTNNRLIATQRGLHQPQVSCKHEAIGH